MDPNGSSEKCSCEDPESPKSSNEKNDSEIETATPATSPSPRRSKLSLSALGLNIRKGRSLNFTLKRSKKQPSSDFPLSFSTFKKSSKWVTKLNCSKKTPKEPESQSCCQCTCYRKTEDHPLGAGVVFSNQEEASSSSNSNTSNSSSGGIVQGEPGECSKTEQPENNNSIKEEEAPYGSCASNVVPSNHNPASQRRCGDDEASGLVLQRDLYSGPTGNMIVPPPFIDMHWLHTLHEDCDETARLQRAREIEQGVEIPVTSRQPPRRVQLVCSDVEGDNGQTPRRLQLVCPPDLTVDSLRALFHTHIMLRTCPIDSITGCHTQVDFIHCLVPDLLDVTNCSFYWGKMDRYEAERLLDGKPEGTFLLRDSAQEEFLFSVSFRKYGRSLHARIEQWNHKFSFDSHDPGVYTSDTVCDLIKHYKDPSTCMFFEPMLTWPLHRNFVFPLQHLCRATIVNRITYDDVNQLQLPKCLKVYLKEYHYRQKVRVERFDDDVQWLDLRNLQA